MLGPTRKLERRVRDSTAWRSIQRPYLTTEIPPGPGFWDVPLPEEKSTEKRGSSESAARGEDILALQGLDASLNQKMHLVNNVGRKSMHLAENIG